MNARDRKIQFFEFPRNPPDWSEVRRLFKGNVSRFGVPYFVADSSLEQKFREYCLKHALAFLTQTIVEYGGPSTDNEGFIHLTLKDDQGKCFRGSHWEFIDSGLACPGGGPFGLCGRGVRQIGAVAIDPRAANYIESLGIVRASLPMGPVTIYPTFILISSEIARVLMDSGVTGCEIDPCKGTAGTCFQLRITAKTRGPARIGNVRMGKRCPVCGAAKLFFSDRQRYFRKTDLLEVDFQICRTLCGDNVGQFDVIEGSPIVSRRVFDLMVKLGVKGLGRYATDPPIRYAVVQVEE
jgi:hypothetical protein